MQGAISLHEFGRRVKCDYTTASRLLSGERSPSTKLLGDICAEFGLDGDEALRVLRRDRLRIEQGKAKRTLGFAEWLRGKVFSADGIDTESRNG